MKAHLVLVLVASVVVAGSVAASAAAFEPPIRDLPKVSRTVSASYSPVREQALERQAETFAATRDAEEADAISSLIDEERLRECARAALLSVAASVLQHEYYGTPFSFQQAFSDAAYSCLRDSLVPSWARAASAVLANDWLGAAQEAASGHPSVQLFVGWLRFEGYNS
jgi:hypothetical protein